MENSLDFFGDPIYNPKIQEGIILQWGWTKILNKLYL